MGQHLLLTVRMHGDGQGTARYHGAALGAIEWPPSPARVFQALVAGCGRGGVLPEPVVEALEWLEALSPPVIAAPPARAGQRVSLFVPNNDADTLDNPRDVSSIRTKKVVQPMLFDEGIPLLYVWTTDADAARASAIVKAADQIYQLGRGVDLAWAVGEWVDDDALEGRLREHRGTILRPGNGVAGRSLACPVPGSLASLVQRYRATRLRVEGTGRSATVLFTNAPKPRFVNVIYASAKHQRVYELRDRTDDARTAPWPLSLSTKLVCALRDGAAARLRDAFPDAHVAVDRTIVGRTADGSKAPLAEERVRIIPLPSIGHRHADRAIRRVLLELPSAPALRAEDIEWAFSGLDVASPIADAAGRAILVRVEDDSMVRHYTGASRTWRSVTPVVVPEHAKRRRIEPSRQREEAKGAPERAAEEARAVGAVHTALRHAGVRATVRAVHVQREPFEGRGARVEAFAEDTRFPKERLWHVELELDAPISGPLVLGDGRFLGLGVMAPVVERAPTWTDGEAPGAGARGSMVRHPAPPVGLFALSLDEPPKGDGVTLARALRRAVMARVQEELGARPLGPFFSGHSESDATGRVDRGAHLAFQDDRRRHRLVIMAPHWLERRALSREESQALVILSRALEGFTDLRAGLAGRFAVQCRAIDVADPLLRASRSWTSVTPYAVTRHERKASAADAVAADVAIECRRRHLPCPTVTVIESRGTPGQGLQGRVRLDFDEAVAGPIVLGRTRLLGGGLFEPSPGD